MSAKFHFINHACFILEKNNSAIIFDPYLDDNPATVTSTIWAVPLKSPKIVTLPSSLLPKSAVWRRKPAAKRTLCILAAPLSFPSARYA